MPLAIPSVIETPRLKLRLVRESDLTDLMTVNGDDLVTRHLPYATWQSMADAQAWLERMQRLQSSGTAQQCVIIRKEDHRVIGSCLLFRYEEGSARAELGYVLGRAQWGKGLMREALTGLISHAFNDLALRRLEAEVNPENRASVKLLGRLGFIREGLLRKRWVAKGEAYDVEIFGLLSGELRSDSVFARRD